MAEPIWTLYRLYLYRDGDGIRRRLDFRALADDEALAIAKPHERWELWRDQECVGASPRAACAVSVGPGAHRHR